MKRKRMIVSIAALALIVLLSFSGVSTAASSRDDINLSLNQVIETLNPFNVSSITQLSQDLDSRKTVEMTEKK